MKGKRKYVTDDNALHLGGNKLNGDPCTFCPSSWKYIFDNFNIKTAIDLGSGLGYAAEWMINYGVQVHAVDGLDYNVENSLVPAIKHDLTQGPLLLEKVDFVNCIEVVEHIEEEYVDNLMQSLALGNFTLITHAVPGQKGWHHVNCQPSSYWINKFEEKGFELLKQESAEIQKLAEADGAKHIARNGMLFRRV
jgi:cyclopropane fatty-acyl-phospholipid synthase-like methyltransferase